MSAVEAANKTETNDLAHGTYKHIKVTLSAIFTFAKRKGIYDGVNPMTGVSIPQGKSTVKNALLTLLRRSSDTLTFSPDRSLLSSQRNTACISQPFSSLFFGRPSGWRRLRDCAGGNSRTMVGGR